MENRTLYHHGVKGQKWGVRRYQNPDGTLTNQGKKRYRSIENVGDGIYIAQQKKRGLGKILGKVSSKIRAEQEKSNISDIILNGKKVGEIETYLESKKSLNIVWLGVDKKQRGQKIAQKVLDYTINKSKEKGYEQLTLEVPGNSPDARHIYEKKGFVAEKQLTKPEEDEYWNGLTSMRKKLR